MVEFFPGNNDVQYQTESIKAENHSNSYQDWSYVYYASPVAYTLFSICDQGLGTRELEPFNLAIIKAPNAAIGLR